MFSQQDNLLAQIVGVVNDGTAGVAVELVVPGAFVRGTLIDRLVYLDANRAMTGASGDVLRSAVARFEQAFANYVAAESTDGRTFDETPGFVHLENVTVQSAAGVAQYPLFRVPIDRVIGFSVVPSPSPGV
jgi:hypothetical protein